MKTAKDWFEEELSGEPLTEESVIEVIKMVQKEVIEETVKLCAEKAEAKASEMKPLKPGFNMVSFFEVDKRSILNCAEILKKEL